MNTYKAGLVSVVIPTYKRSDMLLTAIHSVLNQTYQNIELIVVNDNIIGDSYSQELYKLIEKIDDERFVFVEQEKHINGAAARNVGIRVAKGEYIAFQDDDDYWDLNKIERQVALLSSLDDSWGAVSCLKKLYKNGELVVASLPYKSGHILTEILDGRISLGTGAVLIRRTALDNAGYFDENLTRHQDLQLFVRLASKYKVKLDPVYMQNREICDAQNRPTAERLIVIKEAYFNSIRDILEQYPEKERKIIYAVHSFEIATMFIKEKNFFEAFKRIVLLVKSPKSFLISCKITIEKVIARVRKEHLVRKYANFV